MSKVRKIKSVFFFKNLSGFTTSLALLAGCTNTDVLSIDTNHPSLNHDSRAQFVVLHYTKSSLENSLQLLTKGSVSSHYLIGDTPPTIYKLVDESQRAWHAGVSQWKNRTGLNYDSIGIEIVNKGYHDTPSERVWYPYPEGQIRSLIELLKDITTRHKIHAYNIVGHSDIAPSRKVDPGPLFPWKRLADAGFGLWPEAQAVAREQAFFSKNLPSVTWFQQQLALLGYKTPQTGWLDDATRDVLIAFQMHFRQALFDGNPDAESAAILKVLNLKRGGFLQPDGHA